MLSVPTAALAVGQLDQNQESHPLGTTGLIAQTFTAGKTGLLDTTSIWPGVSLLGRTVEIRTTSAGEPTATVLASATVGSSATEQFVDITFATPASVVAGTQYALVIDVVGTFVFVGSTEDAYAGGSVWLFLGGWRIVPLDLAFRTYVTAGSSLPMGTWRTDSAKTSALLPISLGSYSVASFGEAKAVFDATNCGKPKADALGCLAGHLLVAQLNVANGADDCIVATIDDANALLEARGTPARARTA